MTDLDPDRFEELVEAALQVDPTGLSGRRQTPAKAIEVTVVVTRGSEPPPQAEVEAAYAESKGESTLYWLPDKSPSGFVAVEEFVYTIQPPLE